MIRWPLIALIPALAALSTPAAAGMHRLEVVPHLGYSSAGSLGDGTYGGDGTRFRDLDAGEGGNAGATIDVLLAPRLHLEAVVNRQKTSLRLDESLEETAPVFDLSVTYWHVGFLYEIERAGLHPFGTVHLGFAHLVPAGDRESENLFSAALGLGAKSYVSADVGVRVQVRGVGTPVPSGRDLFCDPATGACYRFEDAGWMWQAEITGGLILAF